MISRSVAAPAPPPCSSTFAPNAPISGKISAAAAPILALDLPPSARGRERGVFSCSCSCSSLLLQAWFGHLIVLILGKRWKC